MLLYKLLFVLVFLSLSQDNLNVNWNHFVNSSSIVNIIKSKLFVELENKCETMFFISEGT